MGDTLLGLNMVPALKQQTALPERGPGPGPAPNLNPPTEEQLAGNRQRQQKHVTLLVKTVCGLYT